MIPPAMMAMIMNAHSIGYAAHENCTGVMTAACKMENTSPGPSIAIMIPITSKEIPLLLVPSPSISFDCCLGLGSMLDAPG